jgi:hypothetical protein
MRLPSEKPACPSRRTPSALKTESGRRQPERGGKGCWDAEHPDRDWPGGEAARIASQPLLKAETIPRALCARQDHGCSGWRSGGRWRQTHLKALMTHELDTSAPVCFAAPIAPEDWGRTHPQRMQQHTHLARLCGGVALPLALLAQRAGTATANAGSIHQAQAPIGFSALLMRAQRLFGWTLQRSIRLESKILAGEAARFPEHADVRGSIARRERCVWRQRWNEWSQGDGRSKFGGADWIRLELMPQFQAQVPHPLAHHAPCFLTPGAVTTPTIGVDLLIFVC